MPVREAEQHTMEDRKEISMVIPCYNEQPHVLHSTVQKLHEVMVAMRGVEYEIIVVNDGSNKYSYSPVLEKSDVKIIDHSCNRGYGSSILTGVSEAKYQWIGIVDADGTYPIEYFRDFMDYIQQYDMVVGKRGWGDIQVMRRAPKFFLQQVASFIADCRIPDLNSGMRIFKKDIVQKYIRLFPKRFSFTTTITMVCMTNFYKILFIDIPYYKREGSSNIHPIKDTVKFFSLVLRLALYFKPLRFFIPLSLVVGIAAIARGVRDIMAVNHIGGLALVLFFIAFQIFFFGLIAEIINKK